MLAGLAAQALTVDATQTVAAFAVAAVVFVMLLASASLVVPTVTSEVLKPMRMTGPTVRRWSGYVLVIVGVWFVVLAVVPSPLLRP